MSLPQISRVAARLLSIWLTSAILFTAEARAAEAPFVFVRSIGSSGPGSDQYQEAVGIGVDDGGNIFVVDGPRNKVLKYSNTGVFLGSFGSTGAGDGQFDFPLDIAVGADGHLFVSDSHNQRIEVFDSDLAYVREFPVLGGPTYLAFNRARSEILTNQEPWLRKFTASTGAPAGVWRYAPPSGPSNDVCGFGVGVDDAVFITQGDVVTKWDYSGGPLGAWGGFGFAEGKFNGAYALDTDAAGHVFVADGSGRVQEFDSDGAFLVAWSVPGGLSRDMAVSATGELIVLNNNGVRLYARDTTPTKRETWGQLKARYR